jgi:hypothetical protein
MYRIIGADGKEYGPITLEQVRQWLAEGRANGQTRVLVEGATEWKTIAELPEFGLGGAGRPAVLSPYPSGVSSVDASIVNAPATGLIITAILGFLAQVGSLVMNVAFSSMMTKQVEQGPAWANVMSGSLGIIGAVIGVITSILVLVGGLKMKKLESYSLVMTASIVALIPCISPCCIVGLPIGIWAIMTLNKPEVKNAFH